MNAIETLKAICEARAKATAGPWKLGFDGSVECDAPGEPAEIVTRGYDEDDNATGVLLTKDAAFIALAGSTDFSAILAEMERLRAIVDKPPLTFDAFRAANVARCLKWHPAGIASWSPSDWITAVMGELGELASLLKMRNRERDGLPGNKFSPTQKQIADELADVFTYLDLLAEVLGVNMAQAAVEKFNEVSVRVGFPDRLPAREAAEAAAKGTT